MMSPVLLALLLSPPSPEPEPDLEPAPTETEAEPEPAPAEADEVASPVPAEGPSEAPAKGGKEGPEFLLHIAPGANVIVGLFKAYGPSFRLGAWGSSWRGHFMVGGGGTLHYSYLVEPAPANDHLNFFTLQGDLALGGGTYEKFAIYTHLTLGAGILSGKDGASGTKFLLPGARAAAGVGAYVYVVPRFSLGALIDFGYYGTLGLDIFLTTNIHFGRSTKRQ